MSIYAKDRKRRSRADIESGLTALHFSALSACTEMTAFLLQFGADPNARSNTGDTPLHLAIRRQLLGRKYDDIWETGEYAVESLRDLITDHESEEASDIYRSIDQVRIHIVETLLKSESIEVDIANSHGDYPQHVVDFRQDYASSVLCKLIEKGADSSRLNQARQTCLHLASKEGNLEVVCKLVDEGHDILSQDIAGLSPFHHALYGGHLDVLSYMSVTCNSELSNVWHSLDHLGKNPLHHHVASVLCSIEMIDLLVRLGCGVNEQDNEGNSSLSLYMGSFHLTIQTDIFFLLVEKGADPLGVNGRQQNLAHLLMHHRGANITILEFLLDRGLDPAARGLEGKTFMHHGAIYGAFTNKLVEFLEFKSILDLYTRDSNDKSPLDYAEEQACRILLEDRLSGYDPREESFNSLKNASNRSLDNDNRQGLLREV